MHKALWRSEKWYKGQTKTRKSDFLREIERLEKIEEIRQLDIEENNRLLNLCNKVEMIYKDEEIIR